MATVERNIERLDNKTQALVAKMEIITNRVENRLIRELRDSVGRRETRKVLNATGNFDRELQAKGLNELLSSVSKIYGNIMADVRDVFKEESIKFNFDKSELLAIEKLTKSDIQILKNHVNTYSANIKSSVLRTTFAGGNTSQIESILTKERNRLLRNLEVDLTNALQGFRNAITIAKGKEAGITQYRYSGPLDKKTRDFCRQHTGHIYTLKEIQKLRNSFGGPALTEMGGYNCRHEWRPVK